MNMSYWIAGKTHGGKYVCILVTGTNTAKLFHLDKANSPPEASVLLGYRTRIPHDELSGTRRAAIDKAITKVNAEKIRLEKEIQRIDAEWQDLKFLEHVS